MDFKVKGNLPQLLYALTLTSFTTLFLPQSLFSSYISLLGVSWTCQAWSHLKAFALSTLWTNLLLETCKAESLASLRSLQSSLDQWGLSWPLCLQRQHSHPRRLSKSPLPDLLPPQHLLPSDTLAVLCFVSLSTAPQRTGPQRQRMKEGGGEVEQKNS